MRFKGWFGPKRIGYGVGPRTWQGWALTIMVMAAVLGSRFLRPEVYGFARWTRAEIVGGVVLIYFAIMFATYDRDA